MKTVTVKTADATGKTLDALVAMAAYKLVGSFVQVDEHGGGRYLSDFRPSTSWADGGPLIEKYGITTLKYEKEALEREGIDPSKCWLSATESFDLMKMGDEYNAETPLIAAMRAIVASELGDTVEIPEELVK